MATHPEPYVLLPTSAHKHTLILLHGTSMNGSGFASSFLPAKFTPLNSTPPESLVPNRNSTRVTFPEYFPGCRFVFPTGAPRNTTVFGGKKTNAWFDITDFGDRTRGEMEMIEGMRESSLYLANLIKEEIELLHDSRDMGEEIGKVVLAGFSQGSAMGLMLLLGGELDCLGVLYGFGGFVGLSGWLPFRRQIEDVISDKCQEYSATGRSTTTPREKAITYIRGLLELDAPGHGWKIDSKALDIPIFLGHGECDVKVEYSWGLELRDALRKLAANVNFKSYEELEHWWTEVELGDIAAFLDLMWVVKG